MTDLYSKDPLYCSECGSVVYLKTFIDKMPDGSVWRRGDCLVCTNCGKRFPIDDSYDRKLN